MLSREWRVTMVPALRCCPITHPQAWAAPNWDRHWGYLERQGVVLANLCISLVVSWMYTYKSLTFSGTVTCFVTAKWSVWTARVPGTRVNAMLIGNEKASPCYHQWDAAQCPSTARELGMPVLRKPNVTVEQNGIWCEKEKLSGPMQRFTGVRCQNIKSIRKFMSTQGKVWQNKCARSKINGLSHSINQSSLISLPREYLKEKAEQAGPFLPSHELCA